MIAYVTGKGMQPNAQTVQAWKRFDHEYEARQWISETYQRLVAQDRTLQGLVSYGILREENEEQ